MIDIPTKFDAISADLPVPSLGLGIQTLQASFGHLARVAKRSLRSQAVSAWQVLSTKTCGDSRPCVIRPSRPGRSYPPRPMATAGPT